MADVLVNGRRCKGPARDATLLVDWLRDGLALCGTAVGCDTAQCGACTVLLDGRAVKSCNLLVRQVEGHEVQTVESLAADGEPLHPLQRLFSAHHALQCGWCTPGMLMRALAMRAEGVPPEPAAVRAALAGNLCRCTGYEGLVAAICEWLGHDSPQAPARTDVAGAG